jgi:hypothetical protein
MAHPANPARIPTLIAEDDNTRHPGQPWCETIITKNGNMIAVQPVPEARLASVSFVPNNLLQVPVRFAYSHFDKCIDFRNLFFPAPSSR